jgi:hypothetical protein
MKRFILAALTVLFAWLGLSAIPAAAQNIYPYQAPRYGPGWQTPLSPYLNLLLPGNTAVNYYGLVEPLFQARRYRNVNDLTLQGIMNQIPEPPGIVAEDFNAPLGSTGHPTAFNFTGSYFNNTPMGQPVGVISPQRRMGVGGGMMGPAGGYRGGLGMGGMGMGGGGGVWPNMRTGMGQFGR